MTKHKAVAENVPHKKRQIKSLQLLRLAALTMVFLFHQNMVDESFSRLGVCLFFVLSGFLNAYHEYDREHQSGVMNSIGFGVNKVRRIFPLHVIMLTIAFVLYTVSTWEVYLSEMPLSIINSVIRYLTNLFLISGWIPHIPILDRVLAEYNIATWFLSDCLLFYIFTPLIIKCMHRIYDGKRQGFKPWITILIIYLYTIVINMFFVYRLGYMGAFWYIYSCPLSRIGDYLIGAQLGVIYLDYEHQRSQVHRSNRSWLPLVLLLLSAGLAFGLLYIGITTLSGPEKYVVSSGFYFTIPVCGLILAMSFLSDIIDPEMEKYSLGKAVLWMGMISPYAYLIQVPVINAVHGIYKRVADVRIGIWCIISLGITLIGSAIYKQWLDREA